MPFQFRYGDRIDDAEQRVRAVFADEFPNANFLDWNRDVFERTAEDYIRVGRASCINVRLMIEELSHMY